MMSSHVRLGSINASKCRHFMLQIDICISHLPLVIDKALCILPYGHKHIHRPRGSLAQIKPTFQFPHCDSIEVCVPLSVCSSVCPYVRPSVLSSIYITILYELLIFTLPTPHFLLYLPSSTPQSRPKNGSYS